MTFKSLKVGLAVSLIALFILSSVIPLSFGINISSVEEKTDPETYDFDYYLYPEYVAKEKYPEQFHQAEKNNKNEAEVSLKNDYKNKAKNVMQNPFQLLDDPMNSPWPMYSHDVRHTGRSPYSTASNTGYEIWRFDFDDEITGGPVIDDEGIIYTGASYLYAVYPNGTEKWRINIPDGIMVSTPAIDENGVLYVGSIWAMPNFFYAIYKSNGTIKWKYRVGANTWSSPAIGEDGTIYFGNNNDNIYALNPNGTLKWSYKTGNDIQSSPAIGNDGTIYIGSIDSYLYALWPNGTLRWRFKTGDRIYGAPSIADDGTIYIGSSWDSYLYALYPNGTMKWKYPEAGTPNTPSIGSDGTIYAGWVDHLVALNPDGSLKWKFYLGDDNYIYRSSPAISADGTIYFGTHIDETDGGDLIAVNPDGTERWRIKIATVWTDSPPAIGEDGTIYIGSWDRGPPHGWGWLHAINELNPNAPSAPEIDGPRKILPDVEYEYKFKSTSPVGRDIYYWIQWDYFNDIRWSGPHKSGETVTITYKWIHGGNWAVRAVAKDTENLWSQWTIHNPRSKAATYDSFFYSLLERFPFLREVLSRLINH
jgi:outer membrane protein assembly factor BamB